MVSSSRQRTGRDGHAVIGVSIDWPNSTGIAVESVMAVIREGKGRRWRHNKRSTPGRISAETAVGRSSRWMGCRGVRTQPATALSRIRRTCARTSPNTHDISVSIADGRSQAHYAVNAAINHQSTREVGGSASRETGNSILYGEIDFAGKQRDTAYSYVPSDDETLRVCLDRPTA
jgi:hypothetical protein